MFFFLYGSIVVYYKLLHSVIMQIRFVIDSQAVVHCLHESISLFLVLEYSRNQSIEYDLLYIQHVLLWLGMTFFKFFEDGIWNSLCWIIHIILDTSIYDCSQCCSIKLERAFDM